MELREIIEMAKSSGFNSIGLRADDKVLNAGDSLEKSHDWDFENDCSSDELLSGTCALSGHFWFLDGFDDAESQREDEHTLQSLIKESKVYKRMHLYLIGGSGLEWGNDPHEAIISDAEVVCTLQ